MHRTSICEKRLVVKVVILTIRVASLETTCIIEKSLIVHQLLICWLSLAQGNFFTYVSFFLFYLLLSLASHLFHSFFSLDFPHAMVSELFSFLELRIFVLIILIFLNFLELLPCFKGSLSQFFLFFQVLLVVDTPLNFGPFFQLNLRLALSHIE